MNTEKQKNRHLLPWLILALIFILLVVLAVMVYIRRDTLDEYEGNENNTLKLSSYKIMLSLLYEEADTMQNKGISKNSIDKIINKIEKETNQINSSVSSVTAKKQEVQSSILDTKNKVNDAYSEKKEEKEGI